MPDVLCPNCKSSYRDAKSLDDHRHSKHYKYWLRDRKKDAERRTGETRVPEIWRTFVMLACCVGHAIKNAQKLRELPARVAELEGSDVSTEAEFAKSFERLVREHIFRIASEERAATGAIWERAANQEEIHTARRLLDAYKVWRQVSPADGEIEPVIKDLENLIKGDIHTHCWNDQTPFWRSTRPPCPEGVCVGNPCPSCRRCLHEWPLYK